MPAPVLRAPGMLAAAGAIFAAMATYGGFLFTLALHLQSGLASARSAPDSRSYRRPPRSPSRASTGGGYGRLVPPDDPVGLATGTGGLALMAAAVHGGGHPGPVFYLSQVAFGLGFGSSFSPLLTLALTHVAPADAADASGLLTTVTQLAQVVGVATFGSLYLSLAASHPSGPVTATTSLAEACRRPAGRGRGDAATPPAPGTRRPATAPLRPPALSRR